MTAPGRAQLTEAVRRLTHDRNDAAAWEALFTASWPTALATTHRILGGQLDLAEDAAQEAYRKLVRYCDFAKVVDGDAFLAYLQAVARNVALDARRQLAKSPEQQPDDRDDELFAPVPAGDDPERTIREAELRRALQQDLNDDERKLFALLLERYSTAEIAAKLAIQPGAARVRVNRLRAKLRKRMQDIGL